MIPTYTSIDLSENLEMGFSGPPLEEGPLPALFYFALSAKDSLCLDPYNQPVAYLAKRRLRVFSITLPFHEAPLDPQNALAEWSHAMAHGRDILHPFLEAVTTVIDKIVAQGSLVKGKIGVGGLSRGAFIASHIAARSPHVHHLLGYAPLTKLSTARGFSLPGDHPEVSKYDVHRLTNHLIGKNVRFHIGNRDVLVGTGTCFSFIEHLAEASYHQKIRSPQVELIVFPSIGYQGHGTPKAIFENGAEWIGQKLEAHDG